MEFWGMRKGTIMRPILTWTLWLVPVGALAGCPGSTDFSSGVELEDGNQDASLSSPAGKTSGEPNGTFLDPIVAVFDDDLRAALQGTIEDSGDLDVFALGQGMAGDRIVVETFTRGSSLDVSIALFDGEGRVMEVNDDQCDDFENEQCLDSKIDFITRHGGENTFLVVGRSAFADSDRRTGSYTVNLKLHPGTPVPPPRGQTLILDFDGATVASPVLGNRTLDAFDAERIDIRYRGRTQEMQDVILEVMVQNYERFNLNIITSDDVPPAGTMVSTIFFGGFHSTAFGLAENVDSYNIDACDDAIIFAESFSPDVFSFRLTAREMGIAIGNVASHEAGHLLGLNHVDDDLDLMDDRSLADAFLADQEFLDSDLSTDILPIGTQDSALLLFETLGPAEAP
jgi:hypothetical protein